MRRLVLGASLAFFAASFATSAAPDADRWAPLVQKFQSEYRDNDPGAYMIAAVGDRVVFSRAFGKGDLEHDQPLTADSVVRIASLTKQFTSVAVLLLIQNGKLKLDDPLERVLAGCPSAWRAITIHQLLNQTSGLTDDLSPLYARLTVDLTPDQLLGVYAGAPLLSPPGAQWRYSNLNYWILGKIIQTSSGEPYADFIMRHVIVPGMTRTRYGSHDAIISGRAPGYESDSKGGWINARYFSATLGYAAGGFLSTPADMAVWYAALARGKIIAPDMLAMALSEGHTNDGKPTGYGFGWYVSDKDGVLVAHHGGSTFGFQSSIYWIPSREMFTGVFKNQSDDRGEPDDDARALLDKLVNR
jgi:CubicO group peptidase (beta-lactamase class C family)